MPIMNKIENPLVTVDDYAVDQYSSISSNSITATASRVDIDLSLVPTSDLLNEAFRRGAIKHVDMKQAISKFQVEGIGGDFMKHFNRKMRLDALASRVDDLEKAGVFNVGKREGGNHPYDEVQFSVDYFVCKHPLTLKKEEPYADR